MCIRDRQNSGHSFLNFLKKICRNYDDIFLLNVVIFQATQVINPPLFRKLPVLSFYTNLVTLEPFSPSYIGFKHVIR